MLVRWTPFSEMGRFQSEIDRFFSAAPAVERAWNPAFDITEDAGKILLEADLPGLDQQAVDIQVEENVLTVKGERKLSRSKDESGELYRRYERVSGNFERTFRVPPTVDAEKISASMKDGVLTLLLPKKPEALPRQIKINVQ